LAQDDQLTRQWRLPFRRHAAFRKADLDAREALYLRRGNRMLSPERLAQEAVS